MTTRARAATTRARLSRQLAGICFIAALTSPSVSPADAATTRLALCEEPAHRLLDTHVLHALSTKPHDGRPPSDSRAGRR